MANSEHLKILEDGVEKWNKWREKNENIRPDLSRAELNYIDLRGANLYQVDLFAADLYCAKFIEADLREADLRNTNLYDASVSLLRRSEKGGPIR